MEGSALRGRKNPMKPAVSWHTTLSAKSSVLYLLQPMTRERGCPTPGRPFPVAAEQADFVGWKEHKTLDLP